MIDIHCHILPGVDDGSGCISDSLEMARLARDSGITAIAATPHCCIPGICQNLWTDEMQAGFLRLCDGIQEQAPGIQLFPGQEVFLSGCFHHALRSGKLCSINHSRYLLVELDMRESAASACSKLQQVIAEGYLPILAHPERYGFVQEQADVVQRLRKSGCLLQVNRGSLFGRFGRSAQRLADFMLRNRLADFVASDAHSPYRRTPYLTDAHELICERCSRDYAAFLLSVNPGRVIADQSLSPF